jgi:hypothetical protein
MDVCRTTPPPEIDAGRVGRPHLVRCHLYRS